MSSKLYQSPSVREAARALPYRNKGIMRSVREQKRLEAESRQRLFNERPYESQHKIWRAIARKQPDRYTVVGSGQSTRMIRVDLDSRDFRAGSNGHHYFHQVKA